MSRLLWLGFVAETGWHNIVPAIRLGRSSERQHHQTKSMKDLPLIPEVGLFLLMKSSFLFLVVVLVPTNWLLYLSGKLLH